jgi:hypothetical protein
MSVLGQHYYGPRRIACPPCLGPQGVRFDTDRNPECAVYVADPLPSVSLGDLAGDTARPLALGCEFDALHVSGSDRANSEYLDGTIGRGHGRCECFSGARENTEKRRLPEVALIILEKDQLVGHRVANQAADRHIPGGPN